MTNVNIKTVTAAVALVISGAANAAPIPEDGLFFTAWNGNPDAPSSIVINLGETTPEFRADPNRPRALSGDSLTTLTNWLGGLGDTSTLQWGVTGKSIGFRGDEVSIPPDSLYGGLTTSTDIEEQIPPSWGLFGGLNQFLLNVTIFQNIVNQNLQSTDAFAADNPNQLFGVTFDGGPAIDSLGFLGEEIPFYSFFAKESSDIFVFAFEGDYSKFAGSWKLDFAPGTGGASLTYSAPVPLPGAVWLLGSALAGMVGVARRRA